MGFANKDIANPKTPPLHNWGIIIESYWKRIALAKDRLMLGKLAARHRWQQNWDFSKILFDEKK